MDIEIMIEVSERGRKLYMINDENLIELIKNENELQNYLSDSVDVIDEAIARQSVTSEDVQEAIEWVTSTGHSNQYMSGDWTAPMKNHINQAIQETILSALQEYQPWVSVEDSPKKDNKYLAILQFYKEPKDQIIEVVEYYGEWKVNYEWNVICYKPLPEPPKGE